MTLYAKKFTFTKSTTSGSNVSQVVNLSLSSAPKALWLFAVPVTANNAYNEGQSYSYGYSDGVDDACIAYASLDNNTTSSCNGIIRNDNIICLFDPATPATVLARANVTSFDAAGFTLNWVTNNTSGYIIHGYVIGGTDILNVKVVNTTAATTAVGNQSYTGTTFTPDFANFLGAHDAQAYNTADVDVNCAIGAAVSSAERWVIGGHAQSVQGTSDAYHVYMNDKCMVTWDRGNGAIRSEADFVSFNTDGLTLNWVDAPAAVGQPLSFIAIEGGLWDVGDFAGNNTINNQIIALDAGIDPELVAMFSTQSLIADTAVTAGAGNTIMIGGADQDLNQGVIWSSDLDSEAITINARISLTTELIRTALATATATSSTTNGAAVINNMSTAAEFTIDWTTATDERFAWFVCGKTPSAPKNLYIAKAFFRADL